MTVTLNPHVHLLIRAHVKNPPKDTEYINQWMNDLIKDIDMKVLHPPVSIYCNVEGNRGLTSFCIIETSHIALHSWDEVEPAVVEIDVFSCKEFDVDTVYQHVRKFDIQNVHAKFIDRDNGLYSPTMFYMYEVNNMYRILTTSDESMGSPVMISDNFHKLYHLQLEKAREIENS